MILFTKFIVGCIVIALLYEKYGKIMRSYKESSHKNPGREKKSTGNELSSVKEKFCVVNNLSEQAPLYQISPLYRFFLPDNMTSTLNHLNNNEQKIESETEEEQNTLGLQGESLIKNPNDLEKASHLPGKYSNLVRNVLTRIVYKNKKMEEYFKKVEEACERDFEYDIQIKPSRK